MKSFFWITPDSFKLYYKNCAKQTIRIITGSIYLNRNNQVLNKTRLDLLFSLICNCSWATFLSSTYPVNIDNAKQPSGISILDTKKSIKSKTVFPNINVSDNEP